MKKNSWLEQNYEKVVLGAVALVCLIFGAKHILSAKTFPEQFVRESGSVGEKMPEDETYKMDLSTAILNGSSHWQNRAVRIAEGVEKEVTLLRSVWIIEHADKLYDLTNPSEDQLRPPVENDWLLGHQLDLMSESILTQDPDGDGFSNLEEYQAKPQTNPVDSASHPPYTDKLMFVGRKQQNYFITFTASNPPQYQINTVNRTGNRDSDFYKIGDSFGPKGRFTLLKYEEKEAMNSVGIRDDVSEIEVMDTMTERKFILVRRQKKNWPTYFAEFNFTLAPEQSQIYVREGENFVLNLEPGKPYKLVSVTEKEATIQAAGGKPVVLQVGALVVPDSVGEDGEGGEDMDGDAGGFLDGI